MKNKLTFKKNISGFKPEVHWKLILIGSFMLFIISVSYNSYLYLYAKKQVSGEVLVPVSVLSEKINTFATPEQIEESFQIYKKRQIAYEERLAELGRSNNIIESTTTTTTQASTTIVATSSKQ